MSDDVVPAPNAQVAEDEDHPAPPPPATEHSAAVEDAPAAQRRDAPGDTSS